MSKIEYYLSPIIKYGLYAILLTPLAFWPRVIYPFLTSKFILFQVLVEIVFGAWVILMIKRGPAQIWADLRKNYIALALAGFFAISFVSAVFGIDFHRSFWGIGPRMTGLFGELHFFAWLLVLASVLKRGPIRTQARINADKTQINADSFQRESAGNLHISAVSYLNFSFFVAIAVAATTFYTNAQWGLVYNYGIFNNPTFLAPYLIFHFFWGLFQTINKQQTTNNLKRWIFGAGTIFLLAVILRVQIRGAIMGLLLGILIFGAGLIFSKIFSRRARFVIAGFYILLLAVLISVWFGRDNPTIQNISPIRRVTGFSLTETTVQTRLLAWGITFRGIWDRPVFGFGPENFNYLFNAHYNPQSLKFGGGGFNETWFDKPHNAFLEILAENGIAGSLAYILIWLAVAVTLVKLFKQGQKLLAISLASAFAAYLGAMFLAFDSFGSWFGLYLMLALLASHNNANAGENMRMPQIANTYSQLASLAIILITLALLYVNYSIWQANLADANALRLFFRNPQEGMTAFRKSLSFRSPYRPEYQLDMFTAIASAIQKKLPIPDPEENINFAIEEGDKMLAAKPNDAFYYASMAKLYNILGELGGDPQILAWAETYGKRALELSPKRQETLFYLARTALMKNDAKLAIEWTSQAVDAEPTIPMSHWFLGVTYLSDGQNEKSKAEIGKALELGYSPQNQREKDLVKSLGL